MTSLNDSLLEILECPACKGDLDASERGLGCRQCEVRYPAREGKLDTAGDATVP